MLFKILEIRDIIILVVIRYHNSISLFYTFKFYVLVNVWKDLNIRYAKTKMSNISQTICDTARFHEGLNDIRQQEVFNIRETNDIIHLI